MAQLKILAKPTMLKIPVLRHNILGVNVYRGYAKLSDLSRMSRADIYDQRLNPSGTQRDLSLKHARDAYIYAKTQDFAFWPEIVLCARDLKVISFNVLDEECDFGTLVVRMKIIQANKKVLVSRVDGNHRLHYAGGEFEGYDPIQKVVSFCMAYGLSREQEIQLFRDINNNQKRMNTSHLDNIVIRLSEEEDLKVKQPDLYIAKRLADEPTSPLNKLVYQGGAKMGNAIIPLRALRTGINYMLSRPTRLTALERADAQFKVVRNYFEAVKKWVPQAWQNPKDYVVLRGAGLWAISFIGADVIDRALRDGKYKPDEMLKILKSGKMWNWKNLGDFKGFSGRGGAKTISDMVVGEFEDDKGVSVKELFKKIMDE